MQRKVELELMTPAEIVAARSETPLIYVPVGPMEWHGPHMPLGTDGILSHYQARQVARSTGGVVFPRIFFGTDNVRPQGNGPQSLGALGLAEDVRALGMDFPGNSTHSVYLDEGVFAVLMREVVRSLQQDPWRLIVFVNGHGAPNQSYTLRRICREMSMPECKVMMLPARPKMPGTDPGHAERWETSIMMAVDPDIVRLDQLPPIGVPMAYRDFGAVNGEAFEGRATPTFELPNNDDPRYATAETGRAMLERGVEAVVEAMLQELAALRARG